jgi:2-methylisocitrate lyase-like PEP mutase family enzyme
LNLHWVNEIGQIEIQLSHQHLGITLLRLRTAIERLESYKLAGVDQILAELIHTGDKILCSEIHKLITVKP